MSKIATQLHSMLEFMVTKAIETGKTGNMTYSIPYYDLKDSPEDYQPLFLVLKIETSWDDSELMSDFLANEEPSEDEAMESNKNEEPSNKNKKH